MFTKHSLHVYRSNHSTETVLVHIVNDSLLASNSGKVSLLTLLDLSAAFDTIDHTILLTRLGYTFRIHSTVLAWFKSYLYDRFQKVSVNNTWGHFLLCLCLTFLFKYDFKIVHVPVLKYIHF